MKEHTDIPNQKTVITISWYEHVLQGCATAVVSGLADIHSSSYGNEKVLACGEVYDSRA